MLWSILGLVAAIAVMWLAYKVVFKSFSADLAARGFHFYGLIGKLIMIASCAYFLFTSFVVGDGGSLPVQMLIGMLVLTPGYIIFFLRCLAKTRNIGYTAVALAFMIFISLFAGYFTVMAVMLVIFLVVSKIMLAGAFGGGGGKGTVTCRSCGKTVRVPVGGNGPYTCPHCNLTL